MNAKRDPREIAVELLKRSICKIQVAAVLTDKNGCNFGWGWNYPTPDGFSMHAEFHAIFSANPKRLKGSSITVAGKRRRSGNWVYSRPCEKKCLPLIKSVGISEIEFITPFGEWKKEKV